MKIKAFVNRSPNAIYFVATFFISWFLALMVVAPKWLNGNPIDKMDSLKIFPLMLLGPFITGIGLTGILHGKSGVKNLYARMGRWRIGLKWYAWLLIPPFVISVVLFVLNKLLPHQFTPHYFLIGFLFGIPAGFLEETGWTGFAYPHLLKKFNPKISVILLGFIWGLWHLPVIDSLGSAFPHGKFLLPFMVAFILAVAAIRVFICIIYAQTGSILLAQLFHIFSTGSLVVLGPLSITPANEFLWYLVYGVLLWVLILIFNKRLAWNPKVENSL